MNNQLNLLALPDETLLKILKELPMVDVLYSLADVNRRLNRIAHDSLYIHHLDLTDLATINARWNQLFPTHQQVVSRICEKILPRIHDHVQQLTVEPYSMKEILATVNYPQLCSLSLRSFDDEVLHHCLTGMIVDILDYL
jgi:F-box-like